MRCLNAARVVLGWSSERIEGLIGIGVEFHGGLGPPLGGDPFLLLGLGPVVFAREFGDADLLAQDVQVVYLLSHDVLADFLGVEGGGLEGTALLAAAKFGVLMAATGSRH